MRTPAFAKTTAFRMAGIMAFTLTFCTLPVFLSVFFITVRYETQYFDESIASDLAYFLQHTQDLDVTTLKNTLHRRSLEKKDFLYALFSPDGLHFAGTLNALPAKHPEGEEIFSFFYGRKKEGEEHIQPYTARGTLKILQDGTLLLFARDGAMLSDLKKRLIYLLSAASVFVFLLSFTLVFFLGLRSFRRIKALDSVVRSVVRGDVSQGAPLAGTGDEIDSLVLHFNRMLKRLEALMISMRHAGDSLAHDLKAPLTRLRNRLDTVSINIKDEKVHQLLTEATKDADDMLLTFNALLRIARLEAGEQRSAFSPVDIAELTRDIAELYEPLCEEKGLDFSLETKDSLVIQGQKELIAQALSNLLDNAIKYVPSGGAVTLRARSRRSGEPELSVTDTGPGIRPQDRESVKRRFVRLETSRSAPGSGLGLSLVEAVARFHGARFILDDGPGSATQKQGTGLRAALVFPSPLMSRRKKSIYKIKDRKEDVTP